MSASQLWTHLRRRWATILATCAVVAVAVGAWSSTGEATYQASADVLLPSLDESSLIGQQRLVEASSELADTTAGAVPGVAADEVAAAIDVERDGTVLTIVASGSTPSLVRDIADAHAASYLALGGPGSVERAKSISPAAVPAAAISPQPVRAGVVGGLFALVPAASLIVLWSLRRDQIRSGADVRSAARVLAELPLDETSDVGGLGLSAAESPDVAYVAAVESLFGTLRPADAGSARRILITGTDDEARGSEVAANLAWVAAMHGLRTVLVAGDCRTRRLHDLLAPYVIAVPSEQRRSRALDGLVALPGAEGREHLAVAVAGDHVLSHLVPTRAANLCLLPSLPGATDNDPEAMLTSDVVRAVLEHLDGIADLIIIDSPAVTTADDAYILAARADDVVIVAAANSTSRHDLNKCIHRLDRDRRRVRGVVVNRVRCSVHEQPTEGAGYARPAAGSTTAAIMRRELAPAPSAAAHRSGPEATQT